MNEELRMKNEKYWRTGLGTFPIYFIHVIEFSRLSLTVFVFSGSVSFLIFNS